MGTSDFFYISSYISHKFKCMCIPYSNINKVCEVSRGSFYIFNDITEHAEENQNAARRRDFDDQSKFKVNGRIIP